MKRPGILLAERAAGMGVEVPPLVAEAIAEVLRAMIDEPQNLSSVRDIDDAIWVHGVDSLGGLLVPQVAAADAIVDMGSGAGFPGIALAAMLPGVPVTLVEAERRKADWLRRASAAFPNVRVVADRTETLAIAERDAHPVVTARALGSLPVVMELAAPLLARGGWLVAWRGRRDADDAAAAQVAAGALGLVGAPDMDVTVIPGASRYFSVWQKARDTPRRFPRRPGMAAKRPLS